MKLVSREFGGAKIKVLEKLLAPGPRQMRVSLAIRDGLAILEKHHKTKKFKRGGYGAKPVAGKLTWRTGQLARSYKIEYRKGALSGAYGSDLRRSKIHEFGGVIKAKKKNLAIPTKYARQGKRMHHGSSLWPRDYPPGVLFRPAGKRYLAKAQGDKIIPMFILRPYVKIPARPTLKKSLARVIRRIDDMIADAMIGGQRYAR